MKGLCVMMMKTSSIVLLVLIYVLINSNGSVSAQTTFYVSPAGSDDQPGTASRPFRTVEKARDTVRRINAKMSQNITVYLRGGTYSIDKTILFDHRDSGNNGFDVVYKNYLGEVPVISGGKKITGWQLESGNRWNARTEIGNFRQLYVNGTRAIRAKGGVLPGAALYGGDGYKTSDAKMAEWKNQSDIEFFYDNQWDRTICKVAGITSGESGTAIVTMLQPYFTLSLLKEGRPAKLPTHIENALELLNEPGEWYLDRSARTVYYKPKEGENLENAEIIVPTVEKLVELRGTIDRPVHNLHFEGITFSYASWLRPSEIGLIQFQANFVIDPKNLIARIDPIRAAYTSPTYTKTFIVNVHNNYVKSPSNIILHAAKSIRFERCTFTKLGSGGLDLEFGSQDNVIQGCHFFDISGSGVQIGDVVDHHPIDQREIVRNNRVNNNYIHDVAKEYLSGVGVFAGYTDGTNISHNEICQLPYSGISVGWGWGEQDKGGSVYYQPFFYQQPTTAKNNIIENNHIHHVVTRFWDGAGVYTLGNMPGTLIRGNLIHDNKGWPGGIYLDEGSGYIGVIGNIVYNVYPHVVDQRFVRAQIPLLFNNKLQNRIATCWEEGNVFNVIPGQKNFPQSIADNAGLQAPYKNLLEPDHLSKTRPK
jgi:hypothetical protein